MKYFELEPEVAGGFGPKTIMEDPRARPPKIIQFNYEFSGWLGDPILEAVACFIVTHPLKDKILAVQPTGVSFGPVEISTSGEFEDFYPDVKLPKFVWLQITGTAGKDDFGLSAKLSLVVSERILELLKQTGMSHCAINEFVA